MDKTTVRIKKLWPWVLRGWWLRPKLSRIFLSARFLFFLNKTRIWFWTVQKNVFIFCPKKKFCCLLSSASNETFFIKIKTENVKSEIIGSQTWRSTSELTSLEHSLILLLPIATVSIKWMNVLPKLTNFIVTYWSIFIGISVCFFLMRWWEGVGRMVAIAPLSVRSGRGVIVSESWKEWDREKRLVVGRERYRKKREKS